MTGIKFQLKLLLVLLLLSFHALSQVRNKVVTGVSGKGSTLGACDNWLGLPSQPSFVRVGDLDVPGDQITVEAEFNRTTPYTGGPLYAGDLVSKHQDPINVNYLLRPNEAEITTADGVYHITPPICEIELNKTYHVAMVYDGAMLKFYRNGFLMSQVAASGNLFQNDFQTEIGFYQLQLYNTNFIGYINEVRIWNVARTQAQIQAYMNTPLPSPTTQPGLLAYYSFNSLLNQQGNPAWNGVLYGSATISQTNPTCPFFVADNTCCPKITGTLTGNDICPGQAGLLTFHPTAPGTGPYTLVYSDQSTNFSESNVQGDVAFAVQSPPINTTQYTLLKITDAGNCSTNVTGTSATIDVFQPGKLAITPDTSICSGTSVQLRVSGGSNFIWSPATLLNDPNISNPIALPVQATRFYVKGLDLNSCSTADSVFVSILPQTIFKTPPDAVTCSGTAVVLNGNNDPNFIYNWSPAALLNDPNSPTPQTNLTQTTDFNVHITDYVCPQYNRNFDVHVTVNEAPTLYTSKSNDIDCSNLTSLLSVVGADTYKWTPESGVDNASLQNPVARISETTRFVVKGTNSVGCSSFDSVTVVVTKTGQNLFSIPNAFTPNGDNLNDCFGIRNWGEVTLEDFSIYNRWGQRVFETKNPSDCWDGTFQGKRQDAGSFVYLIRASSFCGNIVKKGTLLLIR